MMNHKFSTIRKSSIAALVFSTMVLMTGCSGSDGVKISDPLPEKPLTGQAGDGNLAEIVDYILRSAHF